MVVNRRFFCVLVHITKQKLPKYTPELLKAEIREIFDTSETKEEADIRLGWLALQTDYESADVMVTRVLNPKKIPDPEKTLNKLENNIAKYGGDILWPGHRDRGRRL